MSDDTESGTLFESINSLNGPKQLLLDAVEGLEETKALLDRLGELASEAEIESAVHQIGLTRQRVEGYQRKLSTIRHDMMMDRENLLMVRNMT